jgi:hypothetical protein
VRLVDDDRIATGRELPHLVEEEGELLQRCDDDSCLLTSQCGGELAGVPVDALHDPMRVLKLVNGLLELAVKHQPVGHHHDFVEDLSVRLIVQSRQPVSEPSDRGRLAGAG